MRIRFYGLCGAIGLCLAAAAFCESQTTADLWGSFLHYSAIGRFDLAQAFGQELLTNNPDPTELLELSQQNPQGFQLLLKIHSDNDQLRQVSAEILALIEKGRFLRRTDPKIINEQIARLSTTIRGRLAAQEQLRQSGEFAVPFMLAALADPQRQNEYAFITEALGKLGPDAVRPLTTALQIENAAVRAEIVRALAQIGTIQSVPYLRWVMEQDRSEQCRALAAAALAQIDPNAAKAPSSELFFQLAEAYYDLHSAVAPSAEFSFANMWLWDDARQSLRRYEINKAYFHELMAMRCAEWALKIDPKIGKAVGLWLAAYFRAESAGVPLPEYFETGYPSAMTMAVIAGPAYLQLALERALRNKETAVALGAVEALAINGGQQSLLQYVGTVQPLAEALSYDDKRVQFSAAIAFAGANPSQPFTASPLIAQRLAEALSEQSADTMGRALSGTYAMRAVQAAYRLVLLRNALIDLTVLQPALIAALQKDWPEMQQQAASVLAYFASPAAQRALADVALNANQPREVRLAAFSNLALSAKQNGNLLTGQHIDALYELVDANDQPSEYRTAAGGVLGALDLPSQQVQKLILKRAHF